MRLKYAIDRALRIEYPGAYYQEIKWGIRGVDIFQTDKSRQVLVEDLADGCENFQINLIAYVLMSKR